MNIPCKLHEVQQGQVPGAAPPDSSPCLTEQLFECSPMCICRYHNAGKARVGMCSGDRSPHFDGPHKAVGPYPWWVLFNAEFLPLPCAEQVHFPSFSINTGQCKFDGTVCKEIFLLVSQYHFNRWFFGGDMWAHAVWTKEKLVAISRMCACSIRWKQTPLSEQCQIHFPYQQAKEWLERTYFNRVGRY